MSSPTVSTTEPQRRVGVVGELSALTGEGLQPVAVRVADTGHDGGALYLVPSPVSALSESGKDVGLASDATTEAVRPNPVAPDSLSALTEAGSSDTSDQKSPSVAGSIPAACPASVSALNAARPSRRFGESRWAPRHILGVGAGCVERVDGDRRPSGR